MATQQTFTILLRIAMLHCFGILTIFVGSLMSGLALQPANGLSGLALFLPYLFISALLFAIIAFAETFVRLMTPRGHESPNPAKPLDTRILWRLGLCLLAVWLLTNGVRDFLLVASTFLAYGLAEGLTYKVVTSAGTIAVSIWLMVGAPGLPVPSFLRPQDRMPP